MNTPQHVLGKVPHHLQMLYTPLGKRSIYNSVAYCNRCGMCSQSCPIYRLNAQEIYSPRGRNQILRLALERKIKLNKNNPVLRRSLETCLLCGRCTQACPGAIPTAQHVLEMRRKLNVCLLPRTLFTFLMLRETHPRLFEKLARFALLLHRLWVLKIARFSGITYLLGLSWLNRIDAVIPHRTPNVHTYLKKLNINEQSPTPTLLYLPSLEAEFLLPHLLYNTLCCAQQAHKVCIWFNTASGLFSYVYGDLRRSRHTLRKLINRHAHTGNGNLPLLTDSIDVYNFLKQAPQLFAENTRWERKAQQFADCVRFVTDILPKKLPSHTHFSLPVQLEYSSLFDRRPHPVQQAETILYTLFNKNFVECLYTDADVPAFGYAFTQGNRAEQIGLQVAERIERTQAKTVFTLSGWSALELSFLLKRLNPAVQVKHLVDIIR